VVLTKNAAEMDNDRASGKSRACRVNADPQSGNVK
jgi:hypothetical protein